MKWPPKKESREKVDEFDISSTTRLSVPPCGGRKSYVQRRRKGEGRGLRKKRKTRKGKGRRKKVSALATQREGIPRGREMSLGSPSFPLKIPKKRRMLVEGGKGKRDGTEMSTATHETRNGKHGGYKKGKKEELILRRRRCSSRKGRTSKAVPLPPSSALFAPPTSQVFLCARRRRRGKVFQSPTFFYLACGRERKS